MIKIFVVEDEAVIRNGIKNGIDWEKEGFDFVGEASDGELAYPLIKESQPDILITDIKMPFMDGLELSSAVKKELPNIKIIVLSGYNDFIYAKEAIQIGVVEYLLKPISSVKLLSAVNGVAETIYKEKEDQELRKMYLQEMRENTEYDKQVFFQKVITEDLSLADFLEQGAKLGMELSAGGYCVLLFEISKQNQELEYSEQIVEVSERVEKLEEKEYIFCFRRGLKGWVFLIKERSDEQGKNAVESCAEELESILNEYPDVKYSGGVGKTVLRPREIKDSYDDAERAFAKRFISEKNEIIFDDEDAKEAEDKVVLQGLGSMEQNRKMIEKFMRSGVSEEIPQFIEMYFGTWDDSYLDSILLRQYVVIDSYVTILAYLRDIGGDSDKLEQQYGNIQEIAEYVSSMDKMKKHMAQLIENVFAMREEFSEKRGSKTINMAKEYIASAYMKNDISLNNVASHVNVSPSYFSTVFGQEVGKTFVEYLTAIRMDKAKELLMSSNMRTSEVGYEVGYKDAHYFSYIFKKIQGCSPKEYRVRGKA